MDGRISVRFVVKTEKGVRDIADRPSNVEYGFRDIANWPSNVNRVEYRINRCGISVVGGTRWWTTLSDVVALALLKPDHNAGVERQCVCEDEDEDGCREVDELHSDEKGVDGPNGNA